MANKTVKKTSCFETSDGTLFKEPHVAEAHQAALDLEKELNNDFLPGNYISLKVNITDLKDWLEDHSEVVLNYINTRY